jgi:spermidine synthase
VNARPARALLLLAGFLCAACGLVYELALLTLGQYLVGGGIYQTSVVLGVFVCSMGLGSLASKPLLPRAAISFAVVELCLAVTGGLSVLTLYACYAWLDLYTPALLATSVVVGALIGAEIPLLMALLQQVRKQDAAESVADLIAVDYVGALAGGLAFPFVLLPIFGQVRGAIVVAGVNLIAAAVVVVLRGRGFGRRTRRALTVSATAVVMVLGVAGWMTGQFLIDARQALYHDPVAYAVRSAYQEVVVTRSLPDGQGARDTRLFLDGDLQFSSRDEYRYHEALVHPAVSPTTRSVLILGGGDGLAAREVLRHRGVTRIVEVELDPAVLNLAEHQTLLTDVNDGSLHDPRVHVVVDDALSWLRTASERFDTVIVDMPDPDSPAAAKLYSQEFYGLAGNRLLPEGRIVVQAGSPYFATDSFWCKVRTVAAAGLAVTPYHVDVPSFGDWGFVLGARGTAPSVTVPADVADELRFLDNDVLHAATVFAKDLRSSSAQVSTLDHPVVLQYEAKGYAGY